MTTRCSVRLLSWRVSRHEKDGVADAERDAFVAFAMEENRDGPDDLAIPVEPQAARRS
jgi:hypothetical protein